MSYIGRELKREAIIVATEETTSGREPDIVVHDKDYIPWCKIGVCETIRRIKKMIAIEYSESKTIGTRKMPVLIHMVDPYFGRVMRLLDGFKAINVNCDSIIRYDEIIGGYYCRVQCIGGRYRDQKPYKGNQGIGYFNKTSWIISPWKFNFGN